MSSKTKFIVGDDVSVTIHGYTFLAKINEVIPREYYPYRVTPLYAEEYEVYICGESELRILTKLEKALR